MAVLSFILLIATAVGFVIVVRFLMVQSEEKRRITLADGSTFIPVSRRLSGNAGYIYGDAGDDGHAGGHNCSNGGSHAGDAGSCGGHRSCGGHH